MVQLAGDLHREGHAVPAGGAAVSAAGGVSRLDDEITDHPVKGQPVVIALVGQGDEVFHRHGGLVGIQHRPELAVFGGENGNGVPLGGLLELQQIRVHIGALLGVHPVGGLAAAHQAKAHQAGAQQGKNRLFHHAPPCTNVPHRGRIIISIAHFVPKILTWM